MKKKCLLRKLTTKILISLSLFAAASLAHATAELDKLYSLETVGFLKSWDNVDGLFSEYVAAAYKEYFDNQSRFVLQDVSRSDALLTRSKITYSDLIEDREVLAQLVRSLRVETLLRTKIYKEGPRYRFVLDWIHAPQIDLIATETFILEEPQGGRAIGLGDVKGSLKQGLDRLIGKVPFIAHVTGRDNNSVTVNLGEKNKTHKGDVFFVATLDDVKRHPLLKTVVEWGLTPTGKIEVEEVDGGIAFCRVLEEENGRQISRYQKVVRILPKPFEGGAGKRRTNGRTSSHYGDAYSPSGSRSSESGDEYGEDPEDVVMKMPSLGYISGGLQLGSFGRTYSGSAGTIGKTGSALWLGARFEGQLWFTREWFGEASLGFGTANYSSQTDVPTKVESSISGASVSATNIRVSGGYSFNLSGDILGPKASAKLGYWSNSFSIAANAAQFVGDASFSGLVLGLGGELPLRKHYGMLMNIDFGLLTGSSMTGLPSTSANSASSVQLYFGGFYRFSPVLTFRVGVDISSFGAEFGTDSTLSQKVIAVTPSILYYF